MFMTFFCCANLLSQSAGLGSPLESLGSNISSYTCQQTDSTWQGYFSSPGFDKAQAPPNPRLWWLGMSWVLWVFSTSFRTLPMINLPKTCWSSQKPLTSLSYQSSPRPQLFKAALKPPLGPCCADSESLVEPHKIPQGYRYQKAF